MKTIMAVVNNYDEIICELVPDGTDFFWRVPQDSACDLNRLLCEGDVFKVKAIEVDC